MAMIRILHTIDTTGPGGAETVFINLIKGLDATEYQSFAAIRGPGWVCDNLRRNGCEPFFVPSRGGFNLFYLWRLVRIIRSNRIQLIQSHLLGANVYACLAGMICRVPVICVFHGFVDAGRSERLMGIKKHIINRWSARIVFVSDGLRRHYAKVHGINGRKAMTVYNGVDTGRFKPQRDLSIRQALGASPQHILIGALGNIRPAKAYDVFLKAARLVRDRYPHCRFLVAGHGEGALYEGLMRLRRELRMENDFHFIEFQSDAAGLLNNLDIFVLPSESEGFSISTIEAMACGLPVVVTRSGGPEEIVEKIGLGELTECNAAAVGQTLARVIDRLDVFKETARHAVPAVAEEFGQQHMIARYNETYKSILMGASGSGLETSRKAFRRPEGIAHK